MGKILDKDGNAIPSKTLELDEGDSAITFKADGSFQLLVPSYNNEGAVTAMALSVLMRENNVALQSLIIDKALELFEDDKDK